MPEMAAKRKHVAVPEGVVQHVKQQRVVHHRLVNAEVGIRRILHMFQLRH
jgi:hypothetical protein